MEEEYIDEDKKIKSYIISESGVIEEVIYKEDK